MTTEHFLLLVVTGIVSFILSYLGAAVGLILGHLRLPLLVYILQHPVAGASTNLAISGLGAVAGSIKHFRDGRVSGMILLLMGLPSVVGSALSVMLFVSVPVIWSHLAIGIMLLVSGINLLRNRKLPDAPEDSDSVRWRIPKEIAIGLGLGALAAATGLMLGTMRLPMMLKILKIDPKLAVGSNMVVGCLTAFAAAITAWFAGGRVDPMSLLIVGPPTILGSYVGARVTGKLSKEALKGLVGWTVAFSGLVMVTQAGQKQIRNMMSPPDHRVPYAIDPIEETPDPNDPDGPDNEWENYDDPQDQPQPNSEQEVRAVPQE